MESPRRLGPRDGARIAEAASVFVREDRLQARPLAVRSCLRTVERACGKSQRDVSDPMLSLPTAHGTMPLS
jgi:hypothetical protein